jgi:hypothetical protein
MLAAKAAGVQVLQDKLQGVVMHRGGSYPKAEQPPYLTKKSARNDNLFKLLFLNYF